MKAFIVAALLVASVASQNLDILKLNKEKSLFNKYDDLLFKQRFGYPVEKSLTYGDNVEVPMYLQDEIMDKQVVYQLEEITTLPLFREYMRLPLFREYFQYPVFQRYVASIYFQRFWEIPAFQQYFLNPVLFYKYIYPMITVFKYDTTTTTVGDLIYKNKNVNFPYVYGQQERETVYPTIFNTKYTQDKLYDQVYFKSLLDKVYNHLYTNTMINKPVNKYEQIRDLLTEVKMTPQGFVKEQTVGKVFDPITGEYKLTVGDVKLVDEKVLPYETIINKPTTTFGDFETIYGDKTVKDAYLKKMLLKKMMITPEYYGEETIKTPFMIPEEIKYDNLFKYNKYNPIVARMMGYGYNYNKRFPMINNFETENMMLTKKDLVNQEILPLYLQKEQQMFNKKDLFNQEILPLYLQKEMFNNKLQYNKIFDNEIVGNKFENIPFTTTEGLKTFNQKYEKVIPEMIKA